MSSGRQLLSVVGQAAGFYFGGPLGAAVGGIIGGEVGGLIDGPPEGPRLDDLSAPQVEYGGKIPRFYGGPKWFEVGVLWASEKREDSETVGGKGGDSGVEQFSYRCDFLFRVCESREGTPCEVIAVTGVEVDGVLVWTALADATSESLAASEEQDDWSEMDVLLGHEDQAPWSVMEAAEGADNANAYRGYLTVGFTDFLLGNNGAPRRVRIQAITAGSQENGDVRLLLLGDGSNGSTTFVDSSDYANTVNQDGGAVNSTTGSWSGSGSMYSPDVSSAVTATSTTNLGFGTGDFNIEAAVQPGEQTARFPTAVSFGGSTDAHIEFQYDNEDYPDQWVAYLYTGVTINNVVVLGGASGLYDHITADRRSGVLYLGINGTIIESMPHTTDYGSSGTLAVFNVNNLATGINGFIGRAEARITARSRYAANYVVPSSFTNEDGPWTPATVDLRDILEYEATRCTPLTAANIDFSAAEGIPVECHVCIGSAAEAMQPLLTRFWFDLYSSDKLYLVRRGGSVEQTIAHRWTGAGIGGRSDSFAGLIRSNDVEVAKKKAITYADVLKDGETDTRTGDRESAGTDVDTLPMNLNMRPSEAQGLADTATADARVAGHTATVRLGARHGLPLQPGSVVNLIDHHGNTYRCLVRRIVWNRWVWECEVRLDDPNVLQAAGIAVDVDQRALTVAPPPEATIYVLDIPLLRPQDDGPGEYVAVTQTGRFRGVAILKSSDDVTYTRVADVESRATAGVCDSELPAFDGWGWDNSSVLTVTLDDGGTLSSATKSAIEGSRSLNLAAVGVHGRWELIQFSTATLLTGTTYELRGLLRNLLGTEWANADHEAGDSFVLINSALVRVPGAVSDLGQTRYYKAVPSGRSAGSVAPTSIECEEQCLLPYAPTDVRNDAGTVRWNRRSRLEGAIGLDPPLGEASERYDAELYDGVTLEDSDTVTSPEWTPVDPSGLTVRVYQLSELVGRGHVAEKELT